MLFLIVGIVYERRHTREISEYGGLFRVMPVFTIVFLIAALSSMGMPPLNGFIGEITILQGAYQMSLNWAVWVRGGDCPGGGLPDLAVPANHAGRLSEKNPRLLDLSAARMVVLLPLIAWAFWIGLYPQPYFEVLERPVAQIVERVRPGYYAEHHLPNPLAVAGSAKLVLPESPVPPALHLTGSAGTAHLTSSCGLRPPECGPYVRNTCARFGPAGCP